jgi:hypothetical protein
MPAGQTLDDDERRLGEKRPRLAAATNHTVAID